MAALGVIAEEDVKAGVVVIVGPYGFGHSRVAERKEIVVNPYAFGAVRFNLRNRTHTETLVRGKQRAIITELK